MVDNGEPSVRGEWHLTEGATRQRRGATSPRSSCRSAARPSHAAALRCVTLRPSLKRQGGFVIAVSCHAHYVTWRGGGGSRGEKMRLGGTLDIVSVKLSGSR